MTATVEPSMALSPHSRDVPKHQNLGGLAHLTMMPNSQRNIAEAKEYVRFHAFWVVNSQAQAAKVAGVVGMLRRARLTAASGSAGVRVRREYVVNASRTSNAAEDPCYAG